MKTGKLVVDVALLWDVLMEKVGSGFPADARLADYHHDRERGVIEFFVESDQFPEGFSKIDAVCRVVQTDLVVTPVT